MSNPDDTGDQGNGIGTDNMIRKLAGLQALLPQFDGESAITPKYFVDNIDRITTLAKCSPDEKLLIMRSRIRGEALANVITSPDLSQETDYIIFKNKFLAFFDTQCSLGARQIQFSKCKMLANESVKIYAAKVALATQRFFNNPDLTNEPVKVLFEQSKLAKFIEGLSATYKQSVILKDPQTFNEAVDFVQKLQANENSPEITETSPVNTLAKDTRNEDLRDIIESHAVLTKDMINALTKQIEDLKLQAGYFPSRQSQPNFTTSSGNFPGRSFNNNNAQFSRPRNSPLCRFCFRSSHRSESCYLNRRQTFRGRNFGQYSSPSFRGQRASFNAARGHTSQQYNRFSDRPQGNSLN